MSEIATPFLPAEYVIVFTAKPGKDETYESLATEYEALLATLKKAGFKATGRRNDDDTLLVLVKAEDAAFVAHVQKARLNEYIQGVASAERVHSDEITVSERLRVVYDMLEAADLHQFPHVASLFPPHDSDFNTAWLKQWNSPSHGIRIPDTDISAIRNILGPKIALYFAFLRHYTVCLAFPTAAGILFYLLRCPFHPLYALFFSLWAVYFVESWKLRERHFAVLWGVYGVEHVERARRVFVPDRHVTDPATGETVPEYSFVKRAAKQLSSVPVLLFFVGVLTTFISGVYVLETIFNDAYDGPGKSYLALIPTILLAAGVPQLTALWTSIAQRLTGWENHKHETEYHQWLTLKVFSLSFFVAYGSLLLTSFVYIPFGAILVPHILARLPDHYGIAALKASLDGVKFSINGQKLHNQIVAYTLTNQIVGAFTEVGVPLIMKFVNDKLRKRGEKTVETEAGDKAGDGEKASVGTAPHIELHALTTAESAAPPHSQEKLLAGEIARDATEAAPASAPAPTTPDSSSPEESYLERLRNEAELPEYDLFGDYAEMVLQFGYLTLFSVIWPIAPLWSLINNVVEIRSDAFKMTTQHRRTVPSRDTSIGPWLVVLESLAWVGAMISTALVYLYWPRPAGALMSSVPQPLSLNATTLIDRVSFATLVGEATSTPTTHDATLVSQLSLVLFKGMLLALFYEHVFFAVRAGVQVLLQHLVWNGSEGDIQLRKSQVSTRRSLAANLSGIPDDVKADALKPASTVASESSSESRAGVTSMIVPEPAWVHALWASGDEGLTILSKKDA